MKFNFKITGLLAALAFVACKGAPPPSPAPPDGGDVQRLVSLLDYVAADYPMAVADGQVKDAAEYAEQGQFASDMARLAAGLVKQQAPGADAAADPLIRDLGMLAALVETKAKPAAVASQCHAVKKMVVERFGLRTAPSQRPDLAKGKALYQESCTLCHGPRGDADTEQARTLDPAPSNFKDPGIQANLSPYRAYNALTFGVPGTGMAAFDTLSAEDRWSLAFYVLSLAHENEDRIPAAMALSDLASLNDTEVVAELREQGHPAPERGLAHLRTTTPFEEPSVAAGLHETRAQIRRAVSVYSSGQAENADRLMLDAYLQGFEPLEARVGARDPEGTAAVERHFQELRTAMRRGADPAEVRAGAEILEASIGRLAEPAAAFIPFLAAALIYLREGIEAALLVGALLAAVWKMGEGASARYVHQGWMAAIIAGVLTWWALSHLITLTSAERELVEAVTALTAAAVLFWVSFWMISKADSRRWTAYLKTTLSAGLEKRSRFVLFAMAFLAVYREAAETVLFTQALLLESPAAAAQVWGGAAAGLAVVALLTFLMQRAALRLPIGPFFAVSSVLLCLLAVSFAGSGLYELIASGYLQPHPVSFPEIPWMGVHPDLAVLGTQALILAVILGAGLHTLRSARAAQ